MSATVLIAAAALTVYAPALEKWFAAERRSPNPPALRATQDGDALWITWPAGKATALFVKDGGGWQQIALDRNALASGQFHYRPFSPEVLVRLQENGGGTETMDVLGLRPATQLATAATSTEQTADRDLSSPVVAETSTPVPAPSALKGIEGTIRVDVLVMVAADGSARSATLLRAAHSSYFERLSLAAAQASRFEPTASNRSLVLHYEYSRNGVSVTQQAP